MNQGRRSASTCARTRCAICRAACGGSGGTRVQPRAERPLPSLQRPPRQAAAPPALS